MPGPSRRALLASLAEHIADDNPHPSAPFVKSATGQSFTWYEGDSFPDTYLTDPENGAQEGDRLTLEVQE